ncbi:hypothetical protein EH183_29720 [Streptomyces sp. CB01881]|nr:hypothetical protein C2142_29740 [Streptomyces sp. CB01881]TYC71834.1 hypothetical protein EH183_29720 [Streptomyces sp. CB01881]
MNLEDTQAVDYVPERDDGKPADRREVYRVLEDTHTLPGRRKSDPVHTLRRILVHSTGNARGRQAARAKRLARAAEDLDKLQRGAGGRCYSTAEKIAALITVICLALLVFCLIERQVRQALGPEQTMRGLYPDNRAVRPTGRMIFYHLASLMIRPGTTTSPPIVLINRGARAHLLELLGTDETRPRQLETQLPMCEVRASPQCHVAKWHTGVLPDRLPHGAAVRHGCRRVPHVIPALPPQCRGFRTGPAHLQLRVLQSQSHSRWPGRRRGWAIVRGGYFRSPSSSSARHTSNTRQVHRRAVAAAREVTAALSHVLVLRHRFRLRLQLTRWRRSRLLLLPRLVGRLLGLELGHAPLPSLPGSEAPRSVLGSCRRGRAPLALDGQSGDG